MHNPRVRVPLRLERVRQLLCLVDSRYRYQTRRQVILRWEEMRSLPAHLRIARKG